MHPAINKGLGLGFHAMSRELPKSVHLGPDGVPVAASHILVDEVAHMVRHIIFAQVPHRIQSILSNRMPLNFDQHLHWNHKPANLWIAQIHVPKRKKDAKAHSTFRLTVLERSWTANALYASAALDLLRFRRTTGASSRLTSISCCTVLKLTCKPHQILPCLQPCILSVCDYTWIAGE